MRADRLLAIAMMLQHRGRLKASDIADELEVSVRTVLRDVEALSSAGVPVYTDRGRGGGISMLPGYRIDLSGLTLDEATALLASGSGRVESPAFLSAMRKVAAAMPELHRAEATRASQRILVRSRGFSWADESEEHLVGLQRAVIDGLRVRVSYRNRADIVSTRTLDPVGLVHAGNHWYLLALREGAERVYRVSRVESLDVLDEPAEREETVDLDASFMKHSASFQTSLRKVTVECSIADLAWATLAKSTIRVIEDQVQDDGWHRAVLDFAGFDHAVGVLWNCGPDVIVREPTAIRDLLAQRAADTARRYRSELT